MAYRNPILSGFNPDPSCIRVGTEDYLVTSSFEYFPGLPIYHSSDLVHWSLLRHVLARQSQLNLRTVQPDGGVFAPSLRYHKGRFYVTAAVVDKHSPAAEGEPLPGPRGFYVWTDDIREGEWSEPVYYDVLGIDQDLFFDDDGTTYLTWATTMREIPLDWRGTFPLAVWSIKIDLDTGRQLTPKRLMRYANVGNGVSEGPHVYKRDGYYYLITAEGGTEIEHQEWVSRSRCGPQGPWEVGPSGVNPMVYQGDDVEIRQTGHMDLFEGTGRKWWAVFLGVRPVYGLKGEALLSPLGRETFLAPVDWIHGWPIVNGRRKITLNGQAGLLPRLEEKFSKRFNFSPGKSLVDDGWYHNRTPIKREYDLSLRPGSLALFGGPWDIQVNESVTMLLQRQTAFDGRWEVDIDYQPSLQGHEAGTAVWWSKWAYASLGVRGGSKGSVVVKELVFRFPDLESDVFKASERTLPCCEGPIRIHIDTTPTYYTFYLVTGAQRNKLGQISSSHLTRSRPFDSIFTGTHFALYAQGADDQSTLTPAFFSDVSWSGRRAGGP